MSNLVELKSSILQDGKVDANEVSQLRTILFADGKIDRDESEILFEINQAVRDADNDPEWPRFFSEAITNHVLEDEDSAGVVSPDEAQYLKSKIHKTGQVDIAERALLETLRSRAKAPIPTELAFLFETYLS